MRAFVVAIASLLLDAACAHEASAGRDANDADIAGADAAAVAAEGRAMERWCAQPISAQVVDDVAIDDAFHVVTVEVRGTPDLVRAQLVHAIVDGSAIAPLPSAPALPPGPVRDAPAHPPRDVLSELIASAVVGLVDVTLVPLTAIPHVLTAGNVPMVPFIEPPLLQAHGSMFDDSVLDDDEWKAEVRRRAEAWQRRHDAQQARAHALGDIETECEGKGICTLRGAYATSSPVAVEAANAGCGLRAVVVAASSTRRALTLPAAVDADDDPRGRGALRSESAWGELRAATPSWSEPFAQPIDPSAAFTGAKKSVDGDVDGDTLVCRVEAKESFDTFGQADLTVRVAFGYHDVAAETFAGPDDSDVFTFVVPRVHLADGDKLKLSVLDRDNFSDDWVGAAATRYVRGQPIHVEARGFRASCRVRRVADEAKVRAASARRAHAKIAALARTKSADATRPVSVDRDVRAHIDDVASAGGWSTTEAEDVVQAYEELRTEWRNARAQVVDARARPRAKLGAFSVHIDAVDCGHWPCKIDVLVAGPKNAKLRPSALFAGARVVDALGRSAALEPTFDDAVTIGADDAHGDARDDAHGDAHDDAHDDAHGDAHDDAHGQGNDDAHGDANVGAKPDEVRVELEALGWSDDAEGPFSLALRDGTILQ